MLRFIDTVSEWLRRWTRNPLGSAREGSNPFGVEGSSFKISCQHVTIARLAQSAEREAFNLVVVGSIPTVGAIIALSHFVKGWNLPFVLLGISD